MPISSGQVVTVDDLNHLKPTTYIARASADLVGAVTDTDITGASIPLITETDNAIYVAIGTFDSNWDGTAAVGNQILGKLNVDSVIQSGFTIAEQAAGAAGDRMTMCQVWRGTLATAGSHTLKLQATIPDVDQRISATHTALQVTIYEVV